MAGSKSSLLNANADAAKRGKTSADDIRALICCAAVPIAALDCFLSCAMPVESVAWEVPGSWILVMWKKF